MIKILSKDNDLLGTDLYRDDNKAIPMAFRPTITHSVNKSASGTNNQVTVKSLHPVLVAIAGVTTADDSFLVVTKFSALQHIVNDDERAAAFDNHVKFLIKARQAILDGELPDAPVVVPTAGLPTIA